MAMDAKADRSLYVGWQLVDPASFLNKKFTFTVRLKGVLQNIKGLVFSFKSQKMKSKQSVQITEQNLHVEI
jgi:hypothetical protein